MRKKVELTENAEMLVDANIQMPNAAKNVLGALIYTRGAYTEHRKENNDWFYRDAYSLIEESQVSKKTFFRMINLLEANNFIERQSGSLKKGGNKVTQYKILKGVNNLSNDTNECQKQFNDTLIDTLNDTLEATDNEEVKYNDTLEECQKQFNDTLIDTLEKQLLTHKNKEKRIKNKEKRIKNIELNIELDLNKDLFILNKILDIIYNNKYNNIKLNIIKKEKYIKEKENNSSNNENKELKEIGTKQNNTSTNDDKAALSTSSINLDENNEKGICDESNCSINKQPSTTVEEERKDCAEKKEDASEAISSSTSPSNCSTLTTIQQEDLKPTEGKEMPLNGKKLRYLDTDTNKQYDTEAEAQQDGANPWYLYDFKVGRCLTSYTSPLSPSNNPSGITTQPNEEKPTESKKMPSMTIVEDDATQKKEEKAKKHMYFKEVTTLTDAILDDLKKSYPTNEWPNLFKIDWANHTIVSKSSRDIMGYGEESKELRDRIAMDSKEGKRLMKMVAIGVSY